MPSMSERLRRLAKDMDHDVETWALEQRICGEAADLIDELAAALEIVCRQAREDKAAAPLTWRIGLHSSEFEHFQGLVAKAQGDG